MKSIRFTFFRSLLTTIASEFVYINSSINRANKDAMLIHRYINVHFVVRIEEERPKSTHKAKKKNVDLQFEKDNFTIISC